MGSSPPKPPEPPPAPAIPKTADAYSAGDAAMLDARRKSSYRKSFLSAAPGQSLGNSGQGTSYLGIS